MQKNKWLLTCSMGLALCFMTSSAWSKIALVRMNSGTSSTLESIWNCYYISGGVDLVWNGNVWKIDFVTNPMFTPPPQPYIYDRWDDYGVGAGGIFVRTVNFTGIVTIFWTQAQSSSSRLYGIWGSSNNDIFAVGERATIFHFDGNAWSTMNNGGAAAGLNGVWGTSANNVYAVGNGGTILHYDGNAWTPMENGGEAADLNSVWGTSEENVYAVGKNGTILHFDGDAWKKIDLGIHSNLNAVNGRSDDDVFIVGWAGTVIHYDGSVWSSYQADANWDLNDVGCNSSKTYIVGQAGVIFIAKEIKDSLVLKASSGDRIIVDYWYSLPSNPNLHAYRGEIHTPSRVYNCLLLYDELNKTISISAHSELFIEGLRGAAIAQYDLYEKSEGYFEGVNIQYVQTPVVSMFSNMTINNEYVTIKEGELHHSNAGKTRRREAANATVQQENGVFKLGALLPLSGGLQSIGEAFSQALLLSHEDLRNDLDATGDARQVELLVEDNRGNLGETWQKVSDLRDRGVSIFLGPQDSPSLDYMKQFADRENYLLLSSASTSTELSIPDDNVMRCISDDSFQAAALVERMKADGVANIVIVSCNNIYGSGLYHALEREWMNSEDRFAATILYGQPERDFPDVIDNLTSILGETRFEEKSKVGVVLISYDDGIDFMERIASIEGMDAPRWYGVDAIAQNHALLENPISADFAARTNFTCTTFAIPQSEAYKAAVDRVTERLGHAPPSLAMVAYDAYQLAARACLKAGADDPQAVKTALLEIAQDYEGITGPMRFNQNGDRAEGRYAYWTVVHNGEQYAWESDLNDVWTSGSNSAVSDWMLLNMN